MMETIDTLPHEDLPYWMRQASRGWDWGLILAAIFGLLAAWPFVVNAGLSRTNATENYVYMIADYSDSLREGRLYPRWSANVFGGYGAPIPNFFPPAAPYAGALIKVLFTDDAILSARILFILANIIAGAAVYAFVRRYTNSHAGILAAVLFLYSPYFGNVGPYIVGDLAEFMALAFTPLLWLVHDRLASENHPADFTTSTIIIALLLLTHPPSALIAIVTALMFAGFNHRASNILHLLFSIIIGTALSAFYWLPALAERNLVDWIEQSGHFTLTANALFQPFKPVDLGNLLPPSQFTLGTPLIVFTLVGVTIVLFRRTRQIFHLFFFALGASILAIGLLMYPSEVWLLGTASLCFSVAASGIHNLQGYFPQRWNRLLPLVLLTALLMVSLPVTLAPGWLSTFGDITPADQIRYEQQGAGIAVLPPDYPVPTTLSPELQPNRFLLSNYQTGVIEKFPPAQSSTRAQINLISHETHQERVQVTSNSSMDLTLLTAYFPGWQAWAAGQPVNLTQNAQTGLIDLQVPAMNGELLISFNSTPVRRASWLTAGATLLLLLIITWRQVQRDHQPTLAVHLLKTSEAHLLTILVGAFTAIILFFTSPSAPLTLYAQPGYQMAGSTLLAHRTNVGLEAIAYRLERTIFRRGDSIPLTMYWQTLRQLPVNYEVQAYLIERDTGTRWHRTDRHRPGGYPTSRWRTYQYVSDSYRIDLADSTIPGEYEIAVEIMHCNPTCQRLSFFNRAGQYTGQTLILPTPIQILP